MTALFAPTHLAHKGGTRVCYQSHLWAFTRRIRFLVGTSARNGLSPFTLIGFAALIHLPLRIFVVPVSSNLYALHDARCITSRLTRSTGLKLECPHTPIHALFSNFLLVSFTTTRFPSRLTFDKTVLCLPVSTAYAHSILQALGFQPPSTSFEATV